MTYKSHPIKEDIMEGTAHGAKNAHPSIVLDFIFVFQRFSMS